MKLTLPRWTQRRDAPRSDLAAQRDAARAEHEDAQRALLRAQEAFDADPTTEAQLLAAREVAARAELHNQRAQRVWKAAEDERLADERRALEQRREELRAELTDTAVAKLRRSNVELQSQLLIQFVEARMEALEIEQTLLDKRDELDRVRKELGEELGYTTRMPLIAPVNAVVKRLDAFGASLPSGDPRRVLVIQTSCAFEHASALASKAALDAAQSQRAAK